MKMICFFRRHYTIVTTDGDRSNKESGLPTELVKVESETLVRVLEAKLSDGRTVTVPHANVEIIETI